MRSLKIQARGKPLGAALLTVAALGALLLAGCGTSANTEGRTITGTGDVSSGVTLSSSTSTTAILPSGTLTLTATVPSDPNGAGVTWSIIGPGTLTAQTTTTVVYTAPATVTGTATPVIIATSIKDATNSGSVTLAVQGTPVLEATELYPGNVSAPYAARVVVAGGQAAYVWTVDSGALPTGLVLSGTTDQAVISGTPTAAGTFTFTLKVVDNQTRSATVGLTLVINPSVPCLIQGQVAFIYSGYRNSTPIARAISITADSAGKLTGLQDEGGQTVSAGTPFTGTCVITNTNAGTFTLTGTGLSATYSHVVSDATDHGRIALTLPATEEGTGNYYVQDATAFPQPGLAGDWAFGLVGAASDGSHLGAAGRLTLDASGNVTAATIDRNGKTPLGTAATAQVLTASAGAMTVPDSHGRGTLTFTAASSEVITYAYYVVNVNKLLLVDVTSGGKARVTGFMTRQTGPFDATSLTTPSVLSLWGNSGNGEVISAVALGRLSGATTSGATTGTAALALDSTAQANVLASQNFPGVAYTVDATGRATISYASNGVTRTFVAYLDGPSNGYLLETDTTNANNNAGLMEAQTGSNFTNTLPGQFLNGTQWPVSPGPISTLPSVTVSNGALTATYGTGYFYVDPDTGRGAGTFSATLIGTDAMVLYELDATHIRILRFGDSARDATIDWLNR